MLRKLLAAGALCIAAPGLAQTPGCLTTTATGNCLPGYADPANLPFSKATPLTADVAAPAGRSVLFICTAAGNEAMTLSGGTALTVPVAVGMSILPFAVTKIASSGTTATCAGYTLP